MLEASISTSDAIAKLRSGIGACIMLDDDTAGELVKLINAVEDSLPQRIELAGCQVTVGDNVYWRNAEGALIPQEVVRPQDKLEDEVVRKIIGFAKPLSDQVARFRQHTQKDIGDFVDLILQEYSAKRGGRIGNVSLTSFDDMYRVELQIGKFTEFTSDLQAAKAISDECLAEWAEGSGSELRTIVRSAWNLDKDGRVNQQALMGLLRHNFPSPRWQEAMNALRNAIKVRATKEYFRFFFRPAPGEDWQAITINLAKA